MERLGDKAALKELAQEAGLCTIPGTKALSGIEEAKREAERIGYPVMLKACAGGGGRGIRLIRSKKELEDATDRRQARRFRRSGTAACMWKNIFSRRGMWSSRSLQTNTETPCA